MACAGQLRRCGAWRVLIFHGLVSRMGPGLDSHPRGGRMLIGGVIGGHMLVHAAKVRATVVELSYTQNGYLLFPAADVQAAWLVILMAVPLVLALLATLLVPMLVAAGNASPYSTAGRRTARPSSGFPHRRAARWPPAIAPAVSCRTPPGGPVPCS